MENKQFFIHIVIPVFNTEKYIKKCLDSILNQTYKDFDIICVDDGSKDSSAEILKQYSEKYSQISTIFEENCGVSSARNNGILHCQNNGYICFVDSDDYLDSDFLETLVDAAKENNADVCYYGDCSILGNDRISALLGPLLFGPLRGPVRKIIKTSIVKQCLFNENLTVGEDFLFNCECYCKANCFKVVNYDENGKYNVNYSENSLIRSAISEKRTVDFFLGWLQYFKICQTNSFFGSDVLMQLLFNQLAEEYLELYGSYNFKHTSYKVDEILEAKKFIKKNKIFKFYKPETKLQKVKKIIYIWFRPFYKLIRKVFKK